MTEETFEINSGPLGQFVALTARSMNRVSDDAIHAMRHGLEGGNEDCAVCQRVAERQKQWNIENPPCECDCCDHRVDR